MGRLIIPPLLDIHGPYPPDMRIINPYAYAPPPGGGPIEFVTSGAGSSPRNDFDGTVGFVFDVTSEVTVTHLGRWIISGNSQSHDIGIWNSGGTLQGSVTVNASGAPVGYLYEPLGSPVVLPVASGYRIGSLEDDGGDQWYNVFSATSTAVGAITAAAFVSGVTLLNPGSNAGGAGNVFVPVNFKYTE